MHVAVGKMCPVSRGEEIAWLALKRLSGAGLSGQRALLEQFGTPAGIFAAVARDWGAVLGDKPEALAQLAAGPESLVPQQDLDWIAERDHHLVTIIDADFPPLLRELPDAPIALYVAGDRGLLARTQLAIVGSRNPTPVGRETAHAFAHTLAQAGLVITSGLARGIDAAAHEGALDAGGLTLAVAGTGLDRVYPAAHRALAHRIVQQGALISEFPPGTPPRPENFPIRNRILSGLSIGVLVVEAAARSGSLISARLAAEQGREVFAIPGSIHSPLSRGCHRLIRQGAKLVETAQDIVEEFGPLAMFNLTSTTRPSLPSGATEVAQERFAPLLAQLGHEPTLIDTLVERSGLTADAVSSMLLELELKGLVLACAGGRYMRPGGEPPQPAGR